MLYWDFLASFVVVSWLFEIMYVFGLLIASGLALSFNFIGVGVALMLVAMHSVALHVLHYCLVYESGTEKQRELSQLSQQELLDFDIDVSIEGSLEKFRANMSQHKNVRAVLELSRAKDEFVKESIASVLSLDNVAMLGRKISVLHNKFIDSNKENIVIFHGCNTDVMSTAMFVINGDLLQRYNIFCVEYDFAEGALVSDLYNDYSNLSSFGLASSKVLFDRFRLNPAQTTLVGLDAFGSRMAVESTIQTERNYGKVLHKLATICSDPSISYDCRADAESCDSSGYFGWLVSRIKMLFGFGKGGNNENITIKTDTICLQGSVYEVELGSSLVRNIKKNSNNDHRVGKVAFQGKLSVNVFCEFDSLDFLHEILCRSGNMELILDSSASHAGSNFVWCRSGGGYVGNVLAVRGGCVGFKDVIGKGSYFSLCDWVDRFFGLPCVAQGGFEEPVSRPPEPDGNLNWLRSVERGFVQGDGLCKTSCEAL